MLRFLGVVFGLGYMLLSNANADEGAVVDFYAKDHWKYSTKITMDNFADLILSHVGSDKTLMLRWYDGDTNCPCCTYVNNTCFIFDDVSVDSFYCIIIFHLIL